MRNANNEERLKGLGIFILEKRLKGDMTAVFKYLKSCYKEDGEKIFWLLKIWQEVMEFNYRKADAK